MEAGIWEPGMSSLRRTSRTGTSIWEPTAKWSPGKDARLQAERYWAKGLSFPVATAYGPDPLLFTVSTQTLPKTESEYDYAGGLINEPIEVFKSDVTGLLLPTSAEIIIEGEMRPGNEGLEGTFGEFTGH